MSTGKIITNTINTNIILVNTATDIDTIVNLQAVNVGQSLTIRDNSGAASSNNTITINTDGTNFITTLQGITNSLIIAQPYGYATLQYESNALYIRGCSSIRLCIRYNIESQCRLAAHFRPEYLSDTTPRYAAYS